jgi:hypothetical protein
MLWKSLLLLLVTLAFCASASAQNDPFVGVWQVNAEKSSGAQPGGGQRIQTITNVPSPGGFTSIRANVGPNNMSSSERHPVVFDGKPHQTLGGDARLITYKRVDTHTIERTHDRNGRIAKDVTEISKDGKTMTIKQENNTRVYDKLFELQPVK